ncbi:SpoIIE family protein phosphatase [Streptomyces griseiscabiei]|uniref:SpoIIE family protein phosphatase n=1 Tax=Streptomyces griseiscabiei TaxID=2993540 RepID=A0ABU4LDI3_9ACTN|nr:SpoIIE family protein phosphatase [Streptomyces griseiscabiei]MBZ3906707.1 SpoIIE family protein phosphatase [Streptomyces griseiscabiei]MDX2913772.1 SpoIIE family protein phosphatase [Streptomyces griseiscabiei]
MGFDRLPFKWLFAGAEDMLLSAVADAPGEVLEQAHEYGILRRVLDGTPAAVAVMDHRLRYRYVNAAMARMGGVPAAAFHGRTMAEVLPGVHRSEEILRMVLDDGRPRELSVTGSTQANSPFPNRQWSAVYHRLEENGRVTGLCGIAVEISGLRQSMDDLERTQQRLALLDTATTRIGTTLGVEETCAELAEFVVPSLADRAKVCTLEEESDDAPPPAPGVVRLRVVSVTGGTDAASSPGVIGRVGEYIDVRRGGQTRMCLDTGRPWVGNLVTDDVLLDMMWTPADVDVIRAAEIHSFLFVPLPTKGHPVGILYLSRAGDSAPFTDGDVIVAQDLAGRAAVAIDNARQYSFEHDMALELQRALLSEPGVPHPDVEVASRYLPAGRHALVGGDWCDSIALPSGQTLQVVGDVMGHGFTAAVAMSHYRSLLRTLAVSGAPVERVLDEADHRVASIGVDRVATCLLALVDPGSGTCTISSAGHPPPVLLRRQGRTDLVPVPAGPPLGTDLGGHEASTVPLPPGDVLLLYTDGLVEQRRVDIDASLRRLTGLGLPVDGPLEGVLDTLLARLVHGPAEDDVTLLAARRETA